jgi:predicted nucleotidyltransferase
MNQDTPSLQELRMLLESRGDVELAILFGSAAKNSMHPDSDIDIAIRTNHPLSAEEKTKLIESIALACDRPVDLIDLRTAGEPLLGEILKGRRIIGSNQNYARLLTRHLLDAADFLPLQQRILRERREQWIKS